MSDDKLVCAFNQLKSYQAFYVRKFYRQNNLQLYTLGSKRDVQFQ